jgi:hypothetical protein
MSALGRIGAHVAHARHDPRETTENARRAFHDSFLEAADPDHVLPEAERIRRGDHLRRAFFARLAYKSAEARRGRAAGGRKAPGRTIPGLSETAEGNRAGAIRDTRP